MEIDQFHVRQLYLHTLDSLCNDLVGGYAIEYGDEGNLFKLDEPSRSVLDWYRINQNQWQKNLRLDDVKAIVSAIEKEPPELVPYEFSETGDNKKLLGLVKVEAHRFAGIHSYGTEAEAPNTYIFKPSKPVTLFEGANGSGKTSLVNAVIWCLTGEIIRPQRAPERGNEEFGFEITHDAGGSTSHTLPPVTPLPRNDIYTPDASTEKVPVDTWVELTFLDQDGNTHSIRRSINRTNRGKINETAPNLSSLKLDPISFKLGTTMPALIPFIRVGQQSELGKAVAELTGLSALIHLSRHADKVSKKISGDLTKKAEEEIKNADDSYDKIMTELETKFIETPSIKPTEDVPSISDDKKIENELIPIKEHLENCKAQSFAHAKTVLGDAFDPDDSEMRKELEGKIAPALSKINEITNLPSISRLSGIEQLKDEQIEAVENTITNILSEANILSELANKPKMAERKRLYARVAAWIQEYCETPSEIDNCPVCQTGLKDSIDPVTNSPVKEHINEALKSNSELISQTIANWIKTASGMLAKDLPSVLHTELTMELPDHPIDLVKRALSDELYETDPFLGVLSSLKSNMENLYKNVFPEKERLDGEITKLPQIILPDGNNLQKHIDVIERALVFSKWCNSNSNELKKIFAQVIGASGASDEMNSNEISDVSPLKDRLKALLNITKSAKPINECLDKIGKMEEALKLRREEEKQIRAYTVTTEALKPLTELGKLADQQVKDLQIKLKGSTKKWVNHVYRNAYVKSGHILKNTKVAPEGALSITVGSNGALAPAEHVSNASALRASLLGFYFAFWEYVIKQRGGLQLIILDDPQELLDEENEERLADMLPLLTKIKAQLLVTTHDQRFATMVAKTGKASGDIEHRSVHPVNIERLTLQTPLSVGDLEKKKDNYKRDVDVAMAAQDYVAECRVFIEARLADLLDDPAYAVTNHKPTLATYLNHIRSLVKSNPGHEFFCSTAVTQFCGDSALQDNVGCLKLLNKAHHEDKRNITPSDVYQASGDLERLSKLAENLHSEFRRWRRREPVDEEMNVADNVATLTVVEKPEFSVLIIPDLVAFTSQTPEGDSQDVEHDNFSGDWFESKALFYIKNEMFGFSAPAGSIVIVEADEDLPKDQSLVIAKYRGAMLARRLLRENSNSTSITLTTVNPDPTMRPPSISTYTNHTILYRVVGVLFNATVPTEISKKHDAIQLDNSEILQHIKVCCRVRDNSAVPIALNKQLVLGGSEIALDQLSAHQGEYVALSLKNSSTLFKRVGKSLSGDMSHLFQFESIGGLGSSEIVSLKDDSKQNYGCPVIEAARTVLGVIYES